MKVLILATRISGNDGVTLEAKHWKKILNRIGHRVTFVAGKLDEGGICIPELHFQTPSSVDLYDKVVYGKNNYEKVEADIFSQAGVIEGKLRRLFRREKADLLIVPNVLSLPMHFAFAVGLTRVLEELKIPTIARHHDFWWERERFLQSSMFPFFEKFFPPLLPNIEHIVINSISKEEFKRRTGLTPTIIWDTIDFSKKQRYDSFAKHFRESFGLDKDDIVFLQATRIVPRKRIELSIKLLEKLNNPKAILLIAGHAGDEGIEYERYLRKLAKKSSARVKFIGKSINSQRRIVEYKTRKGKVKRRYIYSLWDCYLNCDFITYPTNQEGFGNQFVESMYFKKPVIVTPYAVYKSDLKRLGFQAIEMPDNISAEFLDKLKDFINSPQKIKEMVNYNYKLGEKYLSYEWSGQKIKEVSQRLIKS